jgi:hypothetical protein
VLRFRRAKADLARLPPFGCDSYFENRSIDEVSFPTDFGWQPAAFTPKEGFMAHAIEHDDPEHMIAVLSRNRYLKLAAAIAAIVIALSALLAMSAAMYSEDPAARALANPPK